MLSLGEKLRRTRLESGQEIAALSARTKISAKFLEAIEAGRRDLVPAGFFFRNWTLQYARALSLDETEIQADLDRILSVEAPLPLPGQVSRESKEGPRWRPKITPLGGSAPRLLASSSLLAMVLLVCSGFYTWWHNQKQARDTAAVLASAPLDVTARKSPEPAQSLKPPGREPPRSRVSGISTATVASAQSTDPLTLELHARELTWLVISPDGKQIFNGVLQANESKTVGARESARIKVGNAGGLDVRFNGKPVGELGPRGKVRVLLVGHDGVRIFQSRDAGDSGNSPIAAFVRSETTFDSSRAFRSTLEE